MPRVKKKKLTRRDTKNTYTPSENMSMEDIQRILDAQGGFPLEAAEVYSDSGPRKMNQQELIKALGGYGLETARWLPFVDKALEAGDIASAVKTGKDLSGNKATPEELAAISAVTALIPNFIKKPTEALFKAFKSPFVKKQVKEGLELLSKNNNISNKNLKSLYRVVDAPDIETAKKYATHIKLDDAEGAIAGQMRGRRTDIQEHVQKTTGFDHLNTTTDQSWILGKRSKAKGDNLVDRYGGKNPYVVKLKYNPDQQKYVDILPPDITSEQFKYLNTLPNITDDALAKIKPGTSTNLGKYIIGGQKRNITGLLGPKGSKVAEIEEILPISEYIERHNKNPNFKWDKGGKTPKIKRYQDGGDVDDLLKMLKEYKGAPEDKEVLSSLVSESTQPSGYTQPVLPVDNKIDLIDKPAQITQASDEVEKANWSTILANPLQAWEYIGKKGFTRPTKAELDAQGSNIYDSVMSIFNPASYVEAFKHMDSSLDSADQALLQGFEDGSLSPKDISNVVGNLSDAGMQALFLSMAPMGGRTWAGAIKELRRPVLGARIPQEFTGSRLLGSTAETATTESSALQQLAGNTQKALPSSNTPLSNPQTNQPIVFYHGTSRSAGDKILAEGFTGQTSLMNRRDYAQNYATSGPRTSGDKTGTIIESHVTLNNPMNYQQNTALREQIIGEIVGKSPEQLASPGYGMTIAEWQKYNAQINREFIKRAKELGYDGVYDVNQPEIIVFDPSSIKVVGSSSRGGDPLQQLASGSDNILLSDKSVPSLYETRRAGLFGSGLTSQKPAILSLQEKLVDAGLYNSIDEAKVAMDEIRNPSMNTILPTSGKTIGQIMKETQSSLLDYYTNPLAKARLTEIYGEARGSSKVIPSSLPGLSKYHADPADLLKYKESYGLSGVEILDELYNKTGMLPRYYASTDKIKVTPSFGDISKGIDVGIYDEPFEKFLSRRFKEKASTNPDKAGAMLDLLNAEYIEKNAAQAAAGAAPDPITGVKKLGIATGGLNMIGALETFGLSQLAEMISKRTNIPISYAENYLSDVIYHELNHIHFGSDELPIEIIDGWTPYLTQDATNLMYKGGNQLEMTGKNVFGRPDPKGILQYKSQPVEIQARMGQTRRHLEVSLGYTKNEIENIALAAREESGNAILGGGGGMSFFGADDGAGGKYIHYSLTRIENKLKELGVVNENRSLQKVLDDLTEAAQRTDDLWYKKVIGGRNEEAKAQSLMGLLWRVPVYIGAAGASTSMMQEDDISKLPILGYKKGGLLNKLVKKYQDGGGIFKKLRERRANRRIEKTPVRDASSQEVLEMLASYGADSPMMRGEYNPREKEIVMYKDDPDTLKHEQVHAAQYGPLQRLAKRMNDERSAPIQDPTKRKVYRKLSENISPEAYAAFNRAGKLILDKGEEFEAVLNTGVNAAKEKGVNFNVSFEEILSQLKNVPSPTNNMRGLMKFMSNNFTKKQRDLILKSIR